MKRTLICIHVMPNEIEQLYRLMLLFRYSMAYLEKTDAVAFKASLNLNPNLTDWDNSELKQDYFIRRFNSAFEGIPNINEVITDDSLWGTTQQKIESIKMDYDQFVFCDTDITFSPKLLKYSTLNNSDEFIVVTEPGILHQMQINNPGKTFIPAPPNNSCACNNCPHMKLNSLEKLYLCM